MNKIKKQRIDLLMVVRGFVESREKARALILEGAVDVPGLIRIRPGSRIPEDAFIRVLEPKTDSVLQYVGRGGLKLEGALSSFGFEVRDSIAADFGASTGGFTDCLLQKGARRVYALDVGYGQLAWSLRNDSRVTILDRVNIRYLDPRSIPERVDLVTIDVSFISVTKMLDSASKILSPGGSVLALVKPQFEVGKGEVGKGGVVRDAEKQLSAVRRVIHFAEDRGWMVKGPVPSSIKGEKGNQEYFIQLSLPRSFSLNDPEETGEAGS